MCNLYRMTRSIDEVARLFAVEAEGGVNFAAEVYPGYLGLVIADGRVRAMNWGFPLVLRGRQGQKLKPKPVTNARDDKLATPFWRDSFVHRRCLIPVSAWAEPEGESGRMTRTWYALSGGEPFAVAGIWRRCAEWGEVYAMVMVAASAQMAKVHDRMPTLLAPRDWAGWMGGTPDEAFALVKTWREGLIVERTDERWVAARAVTH
jgi:putative SOS response-associated peptidase YedK